MSLGISSQVLLKVTKEEIDKIDADPEEEPLLITTIKNQTAEKKAMRNYDDQVTDFDKTSVMDMARTLASSFSRTHASGWGGRERSHSRGSQDSRRTARMKDPMRESTMSFFKEAFGGGTKRDEDSSLAGFYISARRKDEEEREAESRLKTDQDEEPVDGAPRSLLKLRRMGSRR